MVTRDLLDTLEARGVRLAVEDGQLTTRGPKGAVTPELGALIRAHKGALLAALAGQGAGVGLAPLPEPLARLVRAATVNALNYPAKLSGGMVRDLGEYVLTCAALYAAGVEPERQAAALWEARGAWAA